jgi:hypothetical protein
MLYIILQVYVIVDVIVIGCVLLAVICPPMLDDGEARTNSNVNVATLSQSMNGNGSPIRYRGLPIVRIPSSQTSGMVTNV